MEYKPWPLIILSILHFIEPILKVAFYSIYWQVNAVDFVMLEYRAGTAIQTFEFFFLFPIAGLALYQVKRWSFPVFLIVELWVVITNLPYLSELYQSNQHWLLGFFILFGILNILVVSYFLLPAVRLAYLDPSIRWWEAKPRYSVNVEANINNMNTAVINNISRSGVLISTNKDMKIGSNFELEFTLTAPLPSLEKFHIKSMVQVCHQVNGDDSMLYGAKFIELSASNGRLMKSMIKYLEKSGLERRPPRREVSDLFGWVIGLIKTGKGLIPRNNYR